MKVYTYSEARQRLARLLDEAGDDGEVRIKRRDGTEFQLRPAPACGSPLDVAGVDSGIDRAGILQALRDSRERFEVKG